MGGVRSSLRVQNEERQAQSATVPQGLPRELQSAVMRVRDIIIKSDLDMEGSAFSENCIIFRSIHLIKAKVCDHE